MWSSTPSGRYASAARRRRRLWESRRRLPGMPSTIIALRLPHQLEVRAQPHLVAHGESALGQRRVPAEAELRAVDGPLEIQADALDVAQAHGRAGDRAPEVHRAGHALERDLTCDDDALRAL